MKIYFFIGDLGAGGAEKVLVEMANNLAIENFDVTIITLSNGDVFYDTNKNVNVVHLKKYNISNNFFKAVKNNYRRILSLHKILKSEKPDVIVSFLTQTNIIAIIAAKLNNIPIIISEHSIYKNRNLNFVWKFLRRLTYPFANALVCLTKDDLENYRKYSVKKYVIPNFISKIPNIAFDEKEDFILAVGRLHPVKRFDYLIQMYNKLDIDLPLFIIGEGPERRKLESLIQQYDLQQKVQLCGLKTDLTEYYKKAKYFILTSQYEAFPNVLLEAMSFGCIVFSYDCDYGPRNIITDSIDGFLFEDDSEFNHKWNMLRENIDLQKKIFRNTRKKIQSFHIDKIINLWKEVIFYVADQKKIYK